MASKVPIRKLGSRSCGHPRQAPPPTTGARGPRRRGADHRALADTTLTLTSICLTAGQGSTLAAHLVRAPGREPQLIAHDVDTAELPVTHARERCLPDPRLIKSRLPAWITIRPAWEIVAPALALPLSDPLRDAALVGTVQVHEARAEREQAR